MKCVLAATGGLLFGATFAGCKGYLDLGDWPWDAGAGDAGSDAGVDGSGDADAGTDDEGCPGICALKPGFGEGPWLVWSGDAGQAPPCPYGDPEVTAWRGHAELVVPTACEPCVCNPSSGTCELPSKLTASTSPCPGGVQSIPFDAPLGWDGTCDNTNPIDAGANVQSLSIAPLIVTQESCLAADPTGPKGPVKTSWKKDAIACHGGGWWPCGDPSSACIPTIPPGFHVCVGYPGDVMCPTENDKSYSEKYLFYTGVDDQRQCTACSCDKPKGSMCVAQISVYQNSDNTCSGPTVYPAIGVSSEKPTCVDINPSGQPLGSKSATTPSYISGTCNPIPGMVDPDGGTATPSVPYTICCKP